MQTIKQPIITIIICLAVLAGVNIIYAWTGPTCDPDLVDPSTCNVPPPINAGPDTQSKTGALSIQGVFQTNNQTYLALSGNVGIGTTGPASKLQVYGDASNSIFFAPAPSSNTNPIIAARTANVGSEYLGFAVRAATDPDALTNGAAADVRMVITKLGNVGIGTTNPGSNKLQVNGKIQAIGGDICTDQGGGKCLSTAGGGSCTLVLGPVQSFTANNCSWGVGSPWNTNNQCPDGSVLVGHYGDSGENTCDIFYCRSLTLSCN